MFLGKGKEGRLEGGRGVLSKVRVCIDVGLIRGIVPLELFSNCWGVFLKGEERGLVGVADMPLDVGYFQLESGV